jgi:WD40 repeat protein
MWIEEVKSQNYTVNYSVIGLYPQSMVYYPARKKFIVSSTNQGQLGYIDDNAKYKLILKDPLLTGATRMLVKDNSLYVLTCSTASSETSKFNQPHLVKLNLKNNRIISNTRIGKSHIAGFKTSTDLAVDDIGSIYIIDDLAAVIHRVKSDGSSSILLENKLLSKVKSVIYHKNGYLLVAIDNDLYKINLADNNFSKVFLEEGFNEINSLHFSPNHLLILAEGGDVNKVHILNSSNSWASANLLRTDTTTYINPNSIEYVDNKIFVLDSHIKNSSDKAVKSGDFSVHVTDLKKRMKVKGRKGTVTVGELE